MSSSGTSASLSKTVEAAIGEHDLSIFAKYWKLYEETADTSSIQRFYINVESQQFYAGGYCNVAIIGDGLLIDIEGDDIRGSGGLIMESLESVTKVSIYAGPLPGLQNSQGASLVVTADSIGESDIGFHWIAKTEDEEKHLTLFAKSLVNAISNR